MKRILLVALSLFTFSSLAHNMSRDTKVKFIKKSLKPFYTEEVSTNDIEISANPLSFNYSFQKLRQESGDHDIDKLNIQVLINNTPHEIECDMMTIEVEGSPCLYIMVFEDCTHENLETFDESEILLETQQWNDFKY